MCGTIIIWITTEDCWQNGNKSMTQRIYHTVLSTNLRFSRQNVWTTGLTSHGKSGRRVMSFASQKTYEEKKMSSHKKNSISIPFTNEGLGRVAPGVRIKCDLLLLWATIASNRLICVSERSTFTMASFDWCYSSLSFVQSFKWARCDQQTQRDESSERIKGFRF